MPPCHTLLPQQAASSQFQPQPCGSSHPRAPFQSCSHHHHHQAAITNVPESGEEFDFTSVEHEDTSAICSNVVTANSTPSPSVQAQPVDLLTHKGSSRDAVDINHFFLERNAADQCGIMTLRQLCSLCLWVWLSFLFICLAQYSKYAEYCIPSHWPLSPCRIIYATFILLYT